MERAAKTAVLKFGGTSVATEQGRAQAVAHVKKAKEAGYGVVAVVSAMGRMGAPYATDTLLSLLRNNSSPLTRDLLVSCGETISACVFADALEACDIKAVPLTGIQAGIVTDGVFEGANIVGMDTSRVNTLLNEGKTVVITGFQGASSAGDITTLGRGGSDTSAVAIGGYLNADYVDILTDVNGIAAADPRIVKDAKYLTSIGYDDMRFLADCGSKVIHPRAVAAAKEHNVKVRIRSTFHEGEGTTLNSVKTSGLVGCALLRNSSSSQAELVIGTPVTIPERESVSIITVVYRPIDTAITLISKSQSLRVAAINRGHDGLHIVTSDETADKVMNDVYKLLCCLKGDEDDV